MTGDPADERTGDDVVDGGVTTAERADATDATDATPGTDASDGTPRPPASGERVEAPAETPPGDAGGMRTRIVIAAGAVVAVVAVVVAVVTMSAGGGTPAPTAGAPSAAPGTPSAPSTPGAPGPVAPMAASTPLRVHVPSIVADSSLVGVGVDAQNVIEVPPTSQPMQAAWYQLGPTPGQVGPAVVLGHVNGGGRPGIFANLDKLRPGEEVAVDRADGQTAVFTVRRTMTVRKDTFPTQQIYGDTPDAELRLITCDGVFDRAAHSYESNLVVFADLTGIHRT